MDNVDVNVDVDATLDLLTLNVNLDENNDNDNDDTLDISFPFPPEIIIPEGAFPYGSDNQVNQGNKDNQSLPPLDSNNTYLEKILVGGYSDKYWDGDIESFNQQKSRQYLTRIDQLEDDSDEGINFMNSLKKILEKSCNSGKTSKKLSKETLIDDELHKTIYTGDGGDPKNGFHVIQHYISLYFDELKSRPRENKGFISKKKGKVVDFGRKLKSKITDDEIELSGEKLLDYIPFFYYYILNNTISKVLSENTDDKESALNDISNDLKVGMFNIITRILQKAHEKSNSLKNKSVPEKLFQMNLTKRVFYLMKYEPSNTPYNSLEVFNKNSQEHKALEKIQSTYKLNYDKQIFNEIKEDGEEYDGNIKEYCELISILISIRTDFNFNNKDHLKGNIYLAVLSKIFEGVNISSGQDIKEKIKNLLSFSTNNDKKTKDDIDYFLRLEFFQDVLFESSNYKEKAAEYYTTIENYYNSLYKDKFKKYTNKLLKLSQDEDKSEITVNMLMKAFIYINKIKSLHIPVILESHKNEDNLINLSKNFIHRFNLCDSDVIKECLSEFLNLKFIIWYHNLIKISLVKGNTENSEFKLIGLNSYNIRSDKDKLYKGDNYPIIEKGYKALDKNFDTNYGYEVKLLLDQNGGDQTQLGGEQKRKRKTRGERQADNLEKNKGSSNRESVYTHRSKSLTSDLYYSEDKWNTIIKSKMIHVDDICTIINIIHEILYNRFEYDSIEKTSGSHNALIKNIKSVSGNILLLNKQSWTWKQLDDSCKWIFNESFGRSKLDEKLQNIKTTVQALIEEDKEKFYKDFSEVYEEFEDIFDNSFLKEKIKMIQSGGDMDETSFSNLLQSYVDKLNFIRKTIKDFHKNNESDGTSSGTTGSKRGEDPEISQVDGNSTPSEKSRAVDKMIEKYRTAINKVDNSVASKTFKCDEHKYLLDNYDNYREKIYKFKLSSKDQQTSLDRLYTVKEKLNESIRRCNSAKSKSSISSSRSSSSSSSIPTSRSQISTPPVSKSSDGNIKKSDSLNKQITSSKNEQLSSKGDKSMLRPDGKLVLGPDGKPILGPDGKPLVSSKKELLLDKFGNPIIGPDGKPLYKIEKKSTDEVFDELDVTKRGKITKEEFEKLAEIKDKLKMEKFNPDNPLKTYSALFKELDKNKDGFLDKEEFREIVKKGPLPSKEENDRLKKRNMLFKMRQKQKQEKDEGILTVVTDIFDDDEKKEKDEDDFYGPITKEDIDDVERIISKYNNIIQDYEDLLFENKKLSKSAELKQSVREKLLVKKEKEINELTELIKAMEKTTNKIKESCQKKIAAGKLVKSDKLSEEDLKSREAFEYYKGQVDKEFTHQKNKFHNKIKDLKEEAQKKKEVVKEEVRDEVKGEIEKNTKKTLSKELREAKKQIKEMEKKKETKTRKKPRQNEEKKRTRRNSENNNRRLRRNSENKIRRTSRKPRQRRKKNSK